MPTMQEYLAKSYCVRFKLQGYEYALDWPTLATSAAAEPWATRENLTAERDKLLGVEQRCVVSKTHREFLDDVLAALP